MGDDNLTMEDLRRQLEEMRAARAEDARLRAESEAARVEAERRRVASEAALEAERALVPQNAHQYMHPTLRVPEPAIVLPEIGARNFEIKPNFITLLLRPYAMREGQPRIRSVMCKSSSIYVTQFRWSMFLKITSG